MIYIINHVLRIQFNHEFCQYTIQEDISLTLNELIILASNIHVQEIQHSQANASPKTTILVNMSNGITL